MADMHDRARTSSGRSVLGGSGGDRASSALGPGRGLSMLPGTYPMRGGSPSEWASLSEPGRRPSRFPGIFHHAPFSRRTSHGRREPAGHTQTVLRASAVVPQHTGTGSHGGKGGVAGNAPHRPRVSTGMSRSRRALGQPSNKKAAVASGGRE